MPSPAGGHRARSRSGAGAAVLVAAAALVACSGDRAADAPGELDRGPVLGVHGDTITLGAITVGRGPMAEAGRAVTAGNRAYFAALDDAGGVADRYRVEIEVVDGADDAATVLAGYERSRPQVAMYVQVLGFRAAGAALEPLAADDTMAGTLAVDFPWSRHQNLVALGTPLTVGLFNALDWYVHAPGARSTVCALVGEGDYGAAARDAVAASAAVLYMDEGPVVELGAGADGGTAPGTTGAGAGAAPIEDAAGEAVTELEAGRCDVVVAATLPPATTAALAGAARRGFAPVWFVPAPGRPDVADPAASAYAAEHVWLVGDDTWSGPGPAASGGGDRLEAARAAFAPEIAEGDPWFRLGYLEAAAAHQVLERAVEFGDLTPAGILAAANAPRDLDFDDVAGDFPFGSPEYREPPRTTVLTRPGGVGLGLEAGEEPVVLGDELSPTRQALFEAEVQRRREER